jgi:hypothetical protein
VASMDAGGAEDMKLPGNEGQCSGWGNGSIW